MTLLKLICFIFVGIFAILLMILSFVFTIVAMPITWFLLLIERAFDYVKYLLKKLK